MNSLFMSFFLYLKYMEHFYEDLEGWARMGEQGDLFEIITDDLTGKLTIAEIGVYQGRGTALICVNLINKGIEFEYHAIDHFNGSLEHDNNIDYESITRNNLKPLEGLINIHKNDSIKQSTLFPDHYFDIVYIDASHDYESVKEDIHAWLPKVKPGGYICGDDYCTSWDGVYNAVNEIFGKDNIKVVGEQQQWYVKRL